MFENDEMLELFYKKRFIAVILILALPMVIFIIDFYNKGLSDQYKFSYLAINYCLSLILCIPAFSYKLVVEKQSSLKNCFDDDSYKSKYNGLINYTSINKKYLVVKILYALTWIIISGFILSMLWIMDAKEGLSVWYSLGVYVLTMVINSACYYYSIGYVFFLYVLSSSKNSENLKKYPYNIYLPSSTNGFQILLSNVHTNAVYFLIESLLYTTSFLLLQITNKGVIDISKLSSLIFVALDIFLGLGTCIFIYLTPKFFLKRILNKWIEMSNCEFEKEILLLDKKTSDFQILLDCIKNLKKEHVFFNRDIIEIIISILSVGVAIITLIM